MKADTATQVDVSVCIPVYNEINDVRATVTELIDVMSRLPYSYEIVVIDDGLTDAIRDLPVRMLRHHRNLGRRRRATHQVAACMAGDGSCRPTLTARIPSIEFWRCCREWPMAPTLISKASQV